MTFEVMKTSIVTERASELVCYLLEWNFLFCDIRNNYASSAQIDKGLAKERIERKVGLFKSPLHVDHLSTWTSKFYNV